jgi:molybdopterin synthase catalytic subunit
MLYVRRLQRTAAQGRRDTMSEGIPQYETWLGEMKSGPDSARIGMYLMHNGVVRGTTRNGDPVTGMDLTYDAERLSSIVDETRARPGIFAVKVWINQGRLSVGDDIMRVLVGGDIRENVFGALQEMVRLIKTECVKEREIG